MSLTDALLLDAAPFEVWIALRADDQKGSGTQADSYDGTAIKTTPLTITSLTNPDTTNLLEAVAVTAQNHGFVVNDIIIVSTGTANGDWWDGTFQITAIPAANSFKYLMQRIPVAAHSGTRTVQKPIAYRFDDRMKEMLPNTTIHIGPGTFETRGIWEGPPLTPGWRIKTGQRILGAGMGLTTVKLVGCLVPNFPF